MQKTLMLTVAPLLALPLVRALPALAFTRELSARELSALALLQATSLPFLIAATTIGREMGLLAPALAARPVFARTDRVSQHLIDGQALGLSRW